MSEDTPTAVGGYWEDWSSPTEGKWVYTTEPFEEIAVIELGGPGGRWRIIMEDYNDALPDAIPPMSTADLKRFAEGLHSLGYYGNIQWSRDQRESGAGYI